MLHFTRVVPDFVTNVPDCDEWQQLLVDKMRLALTLEESEEHLLELIDLYETLLVADQFVELLLQVVEDAIVHDVAVKLLVHLILAIFLFHDRAEVVVNKLAAHRHRPLLSAILHEAFFALDPLRWLKHLVVGRLLKSVVWTHSIICHFIFLLLGCQV